MQFETSVQENNGVSDGNSRSNIACDTPSSPVLDAKMPENTGSTLTNPDKNDKLRIILDMIHKAMADKGSCTEQDFVFVTQIEPNLYWSEADAEQTFRQLIQEGKLTEVAPGGYALKN